MRAQGNDVTLVGILCTQKSLFIVKQLPRTEKLILVASNDDFAGLLSRT